MEIKRKKDSLWRENVHQAVEIIRAHRMRSGLLILGVAIGITTILMIVTVLSGLSRKIYHDMASANRPYIYVTKFDPFVGGEEAEKLMRRKKLTREDADKVAELCPNLDAVEFINENTGGEKIVRYGSEKTPPIQILGCGPGMTEVFTMHVERGRFITDQDVQHRERVIVLAFGPAKNLFKNLDPVGRFVRIDDKR